MVTKLSAFFNACKLPVEDPDAITSWFPNQLHKQPSYWLQLAVFPAVHKGQNMTITCLHDIIAISAYLHAHRNQAVSDNPVPLDLLETDAKKVCTFMRLF